MALKALDKSYESFAVGDVVVHNTYSDVYGVELLKKVYVDETNEYHFIARSTEIKNNKSVPLKSHKGDFSMDVLTVKSLRGYTHKWTPGDVFKAGAVLKDQDGVTFLVVSDSRIWNLKTGTQTTQVKWEGDNGSYGNRKFTEVKTASGTSFTTAMEVKDTWARGW